GGSGGAGGSGGTGGNAGGGGNAGRTGVRGAGPTVPKLTGNARIGGMQEIAGSAQSM
nr:hypothetical protein [Tanacetum cinerariifolium]